jgi:Zn-dependent membrane protease YugP
MFFDSMYLLFAAPALTLMLYAQYRVSTVFGTFPKVANLQRKSGAEAALLLPRANGLSSAQVEETRVRLTDHCDPRGKMLRLSKDVFTEHPQLRRSGSWCTTSGMQSRTGQVTCR